MISVEKTFTHDPRRMVRNLTVRANGGTVKIQTKVSDGYVDSGDLFSSTGSHNIMQNYNDIKIIPSDGAEFEYI